MPFLTIKISDKAQYAALQFWNCLGATVLQKSPYACATHLGLHFHALNKFIISENCDLSTVHSLHQMAKKWNYPFSWMIATQTPSTSPTTHIHQFLQSTGFAKTSTMTSMICSLNELSPEASPLCKKVSFTECAPILPLWQECFLFPEHIAKEHLTQLQNTKTPLPIIPFFGYIDAIAVSSGWLFLGKEVAAIFYIATKKEAQNKGMAKAMMQTLLHEAKRLGYSEVVLTALPAAKSLYEKQGFKTIGNYCFFTPYKQVKIS